MSFSSQLKLELCNLNQNDRHCDLAELSGMLNACGVVFEKGQMNFICINTESVVVAKRFYSLIKKNFSINCQVAIRNSKQFKKNRVYVVTVSENLSSQKLLKALGLLVCENGKSSFQKKIDSLIVKSDCCKRSYIRGAFISSGSLSNPEKTYHLEFVNSNYHLSKQLSDLINCFGLNSKIIERKNNYVVYLKESENIVDLLNVMGAYSSLMKLENVRILKDMRNNVNRIVNCETANINKTVDAAVKQIEDIKFIIHHRGLQFLPVNLRQVALFRLENPDATLKEIGAMLTPSVGKSGVNHRLRKINQIAENLRGGI